MKSKRKLKIGIFIDHDIMIRHFVHSKVFSKLSKKHDVDYFFPIVGHKRVTLDPSSHIKNSKIFRLHENKLGKSIWFRRKHIDVLRGGFNKFARDIVVENLHLAAGSGGIQVGASPEQIKRRSRLLGMKEDEMILIEDVKEYKNLFSGCFHLKVM